MSIKGFQYAEITKELKMLGAGQQSKVLNVQKRFTCTCFRRTQWEMHISFAWNSQ